ncbi:unnamed protein product [Nyctereutes procyonoides]|uniref:(raccoon dog) hypothetical protein n=1 Tax=Nyctereutes procyonoides TaxID=34880 RepID=A0A811YGJ1_NYCPR|nr:unnamed protein product [Nyctereutes procyonoides]
MSFTTPSTFSSIYWSLDSVQSPSHRVPPISSSAASVYADAGGSGSQISVSRSTSLRRGWGARGPGRGNGRGSGGHRGHPEREGDHRVRSLEADNQRLEMKLREHLEKKGPQVRDWGHYFKTIEDLKAQIFASAVNNAHIVLQIDNAHPAADDFRVKYEMELAMHQSVESDIHGLCKVIDDTNVTRLQLETEIEALKEQLLFMKKNHEEEVKGLQNQIAKSGLTVELDAPKSQDLSKIMADIRAQYDELAQKNPEELDKYWSQQMEENTAVVTMQTAEIGDEMTLTELRRTAHRDRYVMERPNGVLLHLESELSQTQAEGQCQAQEYEALLNVKVKLEAEIDFSLTDALDNSNSLQTIQKTTTCKIVDSKVVSETNNTKTLRR